MALPCAGTWCVVRVYLHVLSIDDDGNYRGLQSDPKVKAGKEGAFKASVVWFIKHL